MICEIASDSPISCSRMPARCARSTRASNFSWGRGLLGLNNGAEPFFLLFNQTEGHIDRAYCLDCGVSW